MNKKTFPVDTSTSLLARLLRGHLLHRFRGSLPFGLLQSVFDEACAMAHSTGFPELVLPVLAEEKLRHAAEEFRTAERQAHAA